MGLLDLIKSFISTSKIEEKIQWKINAFEDIEFVFPPQAVENPESFAKNNPFFALQYAYFKALQDSYSINRVSDGFIVPSIILPDLKCHRILQGVIKSIFEATRPEPISP